MVNLFDKAFQLKLRFNVYLRHKAALFNCCAKLS